jgi:hypothetical protein
MADEKSPEEIKAEEEKVKAEKDAKEKAEAEAKAKENENEPVKIKDGLATLPAKDYYKVSEKANDMDVWKERALENQRILDEKKAEDQKKEEEQKIKDQKFEELFNDEKKKNEDMITKFNNQKIDNALMVKAMKEGIKKGDYVRLIDKSTVKMDDTGKVTGVDEVIESFKKDNPDLFGSDQAPGVDTTQGSRQTGPLSDDEVRALKPKELMEIKKKDPGLYERWKKLCSKGIPIPGSG